MAQDSFLAVVVEHEQVALVQVGVQDASQDGLIVWQELRFSLLLLLLFA